MPRLQSKLNPASAAFQDNAALMHERLAEVQALQAKVVAESGSKRARFEQRGQLLPRERVARLVDADTHFHEPSPLAGLGMHDDDGDGDGVDAVHGGGSDPRDTRRVLALGLCLAAEADQRVLRPNSFGVAHM